jgi:hypothetical protein
MKGLLIFVAMALGLVLAFGIFACDRNSEEARKKDLHKVFRQFVDMAFGCEPVTEDSISEILPMVFFKEEEKDKIPSIVAKFKRISEMQESEEKLAALRDLAEMDEAAAKKKFEEMEKHRKENCDERIKTFGVGKGDGNLTRIEVALETSRRMTGVEMSACKIKGDWYLLNDVTGNMQKTMLPKMKNEYVEQCAGKEYLLAQMEEEMQDLLERAGRVVPGSIKHNKYLDGFASGMPIYFPTDGGIQDYLCVEQVNAPKNRKCSTLYPQMKLVQQYNSIEDIISFLVRHYNNQWGKNNPYDGSPLFTTDITAKGNVIFQKLSDNRIKVYGIAPNGAVVANASVGMDNIAHNE